MNKRARILLAVVAAACGIATAEAQRPLGTVTLSTTGVTNGRPVGLPEFTSVTQFKVVAPGVLNSPSSGVGQIAIAIPQVPREVDVFYSGHGGTSWWSQTGQTVMPLVPAFFDELLAQGHTIVMIRWLGGGWFWAYPGQRYGMELLAARPATITKWVYDHLAAPEGVPLKLIGGSAGSCQIAYMLSSYGMGQYVDTAVMNSGPPFAEIGRGCLLDGKYSYNNSETQMIDASFGYNDSVSPGPCRLHDPSGSIAWAQNSVDTGGIQYVWPSTRSILITGNRDSQEILLRAYDFRDLLRSCGEPIEWYPIATMAHTLQQSVDGMNLLSNLLEQ